MSQTRSTCKPICSDAIAGMQALKKNKNSAHDEQIQKNSVILQCRNNTADILRKQQNLSLTENLDNSLHASKRHEVVPLVMCINLRPYERRHTYILRCELNFIPCVQAVQSLLSGMK